MSSAAEGSGVVDVETGVVLWFDSAKGYGFVESDSGDSAFVHHRNIKMDGYRNLCEGDRVSFYMMPSAKGWSAQSVEVLDVPLTQSIDLLEQ